LGEVRFAPEKRTSEHQTSHPSARCRVHTVDADVSNPLAESYP